MINTSKVSSALGVDVEISAIMATELEKWGAMYTGEASWLSNETKSLKLGAAISSEIARMATVEAEIDITGSERADYLQSVVDGVLSQLRTQAEYNAAYGGIVLKPYVANGKMQIDYVRADGFYPVSFSGEMLTACVFTDQVKQGAHWYTKLEYHNWNEQNEEYTVINAAFRSTSQNTLGSSVSLESIPAWATLEEEIGIANVKAPLFAYAKYPLANDIDPASPLGVSCFSRATDLIEQADTVWSGLVWEFESGKRAIYVDEQAFEKNSDGELQIPERRMFRPLKASGIIGDGGELFREWSPAFREASYQNGLQTIFKEIEKRTGLAYGTLSDPMEAAKTATEIKSSKQRTYATVVDFQKALETALERLVYAIDTLTTLYKLSPNGSYETVYNWDDSIIIDRDALRVQLLQDLQSGVISKKEYRMKVYGEAEEVAEQRLAEIQSSETSFFEGE